MQHLYLPSFSSGVSFDIRPEFLSVLQHTLTTWIGRFYGQNKGHSFVTFEVDCGLRYRRY